ncbi:hypothetical protein CRUP_034864, partial [Coryphaenoides rupestris]
MSIDLAVGYTLAGFSSLIISELTWQEYSAVCVFSPVEHFQRCDCQNGAKCYHINGACLCDTGFKGPNCQERFCPPGLYGLICDKYCPCEAANTVRYIRQTPGERASVPGYRQEHRCDCQNGAKCYHINGACLCDTGFKGPNCQERFCPPGLYGLICDKYCPCEAANTVSCHPLSGECSCSSGWTGLYCNESCPSGYYGDSCGSACDCAHGTECHSVTGSCICPTGLM